MQTQRIPTSQRIIHIVPRKATMRKTKKIGDILKSLGLTEIGTGESDLSVNRDNLLYK